MARFKSRPNASRTPKYKTRAGPKQKPKNTQKVKKFSAQEKKSWRKGFFFGLFLRKKKTEKSKAAEKGAKKKFGWFSFLSFNENGDIFNVDSVGTSRSDALKKARQHLKRDPEIPCWSVEITNQKGSSDYFRNVTVYNNGRVHDDWRSQYRSEDDHIRAKYPDLSKPVKK